MFNMRQLSFIMGLVVFPQTGNKSSLGIITL